MTASLAKLHPRGAGFLAAEFIYGHDCIQFSVAELYINVDFGKNENSRKTRTFISGPMTANRPAFDTEAARLRSLGHTAINPFELSYPSDDFESCMSIALRALRQCDEISMLSGWEDAPGAVVEYQAAVRLGLVITLPCTLAAEHEFAMLMLRIAVRLRVGLPAVDSQSAGGVAG